MYVDWDRLIWVGLACSAAWMAAVGWYVGLVHYPAFRFVTAEEWTQFHAMHTSATGILVGPPMIIQILCSFAALSLSDSWWVKGSVVLCLALSVGWTGVVSGPIHMKLVTKDAELIEQLIRTNWPRALAWTLQAVLAAWMLVKR